MGCIIYFPQPVPAENCHYQATAPVIQCMLLVIKIEIKYHTVLLVVLNIYNIDKKYHFDQCFYFSLRY
jgi:hypothetical protein